jgi:hypothetical protein
VSDFYSELAETLHGIADDVAGLAGTGLEPLVHAGLTFLPQHTLTDEEKVAAIDAVATALLGKPGALQKLNAGGYHHHVDGWRGAVEISVFSAVSGPEDRAKDEEIARLRAEVARLTGRIVEDTAETLTPGRNDVDPLTGGSLAALIEEGAAAAVAAGDLPAGAPLPHRLPDSVPADAPHPAFIGGPADVDNKHLQLAGETWVDCEQEHRVACACGEVFGAPDLDVAEAALTAHISRATATAVPR